jgi:DNA-binding PucR family transcriptional regulator
LGSAGDVGAVARALQAAATCTDRKVVVGIGPRSLDWGASWRAATACLRLASTTQTPGAIVDDEALGPLRFLLSAPDHSEIRAMVQRVLAPLIRHDAERQSELLLTLRVYLEADGHHGTVATACHVHINTVKYRIAQIEPLLERSLSSAETKFELGLALRLVDLFASVGEDLLDDLPTSRGS